MNSFSPKFQLPENPELVIASDVHIREANDARSLALQQLLDAALLAKAKAVVLNGDIFDFFFGWGDYFSRRHDGVFKRLEALARAGATVWFVEGNHEFGMERMKTAGVRFVDGFGDILTLASGKKVLIVHGDLMRHDPNYLAFRSVVRARWFSFMASCMPQILLDMFTQWFASTSRKKDKYRTLHHDRILASAEDCLKRSGVDAMVFGHFHHPYDVATSTGGRILSVDSWDHPSCLVYKDGVFQRIRPT